jgi:hypothetical protein
MPDALPTHREMEFLHLANSIIPHVNSIVNISSPELVLGCESSSVYAMNN